MKHIFDEKLSEYIDGIIDAKDKDYIETHLKECKECYSNYKDLLKTINLLGQLKHITLYPETFENIHKTTKNNKNKKRLLNIKSATAVALALSIILFITIMFYPYSSKHNLITKQNENSQKLDYIIFSNIDFENAFSLLKRHNAKLIKFSNSFIIAEAEKNKFATLKNLLNPHKIKVNPYLKSTSTNSSYQNQKIIYNSQTNSIPDKEKIVFRIQLK